MSKAFFKGIENSEDNHRVPLNEVLGNLNYNDQGLIPVITQDASSKTVLMQAWMNEESLQKTLATNRMVYWSRSRSALWEKGETSGHTQKLVKMLIDCDGDSILCLVNQQGAACHTNRPDCFYLEVSTEDDEVRINGSATP